MSEWIKWNGGVCPVEDIEVVNVELRDGRRDISEACRFTWLHDGSGSDIIGYRVATPVSTDNLLKQPIGAIRTECEERSMSNCSKGQEPNCVCERCRPDLCEKSEGEHTGGHSSYYDVTIETWTNPKHQRDEPVTICCNDIIEALDMNYAQGNAFKAIWRIAAAKQGKLKKGNTTLYDAEKNVFFGDRILIQESTD